MIGQRIKVQRILKSLTQEQLAEMLGVSAGYISQIERGKTTINLRTLIGIADCLKCDLGLLVSNINEESPAYLHQEIMEIFNSTSAEGRQLIVDISRLIAKQEQLHSREDE